MAGKARLPPRRWAVLVPALALSALVLSATMAPFTTAAVAGAVPTASVGAAATEVALVEVAWNGANVSSHGQPSSAFSISGAGTAAVNYSFYETNSFTIANVTLQLTYLGEVLTTARAHPHATLATGPVALAPAVYSTRATAEVNWSLGSISSLLGGVFQLTAGLVNATGATVWSETFDVFDRAPYTVGSGAIIILLILTVAELYWGISAIVSARKGSRPPPSSPPTPASPTTPGPGASPPTGSPPAPENGPGSETPPGSGGGGPT